MKSYGALLLTALLLLGGCTQGESYDILIRGGSLVDGTGAPRVLYDIAVKNGRAYLIDPGAGVQALEVIDATGNIVAPGFVDVHNHTGWAIRLEENRLNEAFIRQGVTTIVAGADGGAAPSVIQQLIELYGQNGIGTNVAFYVGHNGIRREVMGDHQQREPSPDELKAMKQLVRDGMELGTVGLSTGLMYDPGMYSTTDEIVALAREVAPYGGIYDSHVRNPALAWLESNREAIEIGQRAGIPVKLGHLKEVGLHNVGQTEKLIRMVEKARSNDVDVVSDQYPYDAAGGSMTLFGILIVSDEQETNAELHADSTFDVTVFLADEENRISTQQWSENGLDGGFSWIKAIGYTSFRIVSSQDYPDMVDKYISELATERDVHPFDVIVDLLVHAQHPIQVKGGIKEETVREIMRQPWNMIASDGAYVDQHSSSIGHPRSTGTFPRVLGHYVRDIQLFSLEEGIRKMTSFPADFVGLHSRGRLEDGLPADIVVFDPNTIGDRSTYDEPNTYSEGVLHVLVNGIIVMRNGKMTGKAPGKFLPREH